jgi:hypothetical protein
MPRDRVSRLALGLLLLVVGCSDSGPEPFPDGGDPGADRAADGDAAGEPDGDSGVDDGAPVYDDGGPGDPGTDRADPDEPGAADGDGDGVPDGSGDSSDAGDGGFDPCPGPEEYIGDDWAGMLTVGTDQCFLAASIEGRPLEEMYSTQAIMRIAAGSYAVPIEEGTYPMRLPVCVQRFEPTDIFTLGDVGEVTVQRYGEVVYLSLWQDVYDQLGQAWRLRVSMYGEGTDVEVEIGYILGEEYSYYMYENTFSYYERWRHHVTFSGGELTSDFFAAWGGTPSSGLLVGASGTLDGVAFDQSDYWKLVNNHDHHFFGADWAVIFDAPIGGACGLRIDDGNPIGSMTMYDLTVHTIDCDLQFIEERAESKQNAVTFELDACPCPGFLP